MSKSTATQSQGTTTFIDLDKPYPDESFTVVIWERDKAAVGIVSSSGQLCVTGTITDYRGGAEIIPHDSASWKVPAVQLSNDPHYTNSDGRQIHSPAYSSGGPPAGATALCAGGTYSFSRHRSGTCSHHGGVAKWLQRISRVRLALLLSRSIADLVASVVFATHFPEQPDSRRVSTEHGDRAGYTTCEAVQRSVTWNTHPWPQFRLWSKVNRYEMRGKLKSSLLCDAKADRNLRTLSQKLRFSLET